jgi:hypothetical protein
MLIAPPDGRPDLAVPSRWQRTRARAAARWDRAAAAGRRLAARARGWKWAPALPGLAGIGLVSAAFGSRFGVWAGLLCAGLCLIVIDRRLS